MLVEKLFHLGIPTYTTTIYTPVPTVASIKFNIAKDLPTQIGRIFGLNIFCDTVTPTNDALITTANSQNLYLSFKSGNTAFFEDMRLDSMLSLFVGVPNARNQIYLPVNIPDGFDLSTSYYSNPTSIVTGTIALQLWYIDKNMYKRLKEKKIVLDI